MTQSVKETRLIGIPGAGKTTELSRLILETVKQVGSDAVLVASYSKAAAVELGSRHLPLDDSRVGTLHALAYRALGQPIIAETKISEWNAEFPRFTLTASNAGNDGASWDQSMATDADAMMSAYQTQRARMVPIEQMEYQGAVFDGIFADFVSTWNAWCSDLDYIDFGSMIERAYHELDGAPGDPKVMFLDEAQDLAPIELALARKWAQSMERLYVAGDDEQAICTFRGADPEAIFGGDPETFDQRILSHSYRCPRAVLAKAEAWVRQLSWRVDRQYEPRREIVGQDDDGRPVYGDKVAEGSVDTMWQADYDEPGAAVERIRELIDQDKTVMFLSSCSYMLKPVCAALKEAGVPYHNPYQPRRADLNPLDPGSRTRKTALYRVARYFATHPDFLPDGARVWDAEELSAWATCIRTDDLFKRGVKTRLASKDFDLPGDPSERVSAIAALLREDSGSLPDEDHIGLAFGGDPDWLARRLTGDLGARMKYPVQIAKNFGPRTLLERPRCVVGTIHSTKGSEADYVFVCPDISRAGMDEWTAGGARQDSVRRLLYVAMTRAKEGLFLLGNASQNYVQGLW